MEMNSVKAVSLVTILFYILMLQLYFLGCSSLSGVCFGIGFTTSLFLNTEYLNYVQYKK